MSFWTHFGVILRSFWGHFGVCWTTLELLGSIWVHPGANLWSRGPPGGFGHHFSTPVLGPLFGPKSLRNKGFIRVWRQNGRPKSKFFPARFARRDFLCNSLRKSLHKGISLRGCPFPARPRATPRAKACSRSILLNLL